MEKEDLNNIPDDVIKEYLYEFCNTYYGIKNENYKKTTKKFNKRRVKKIVVCK